MIYRRIISSLKRKRQTRHQLHEDYRALSHLSDHMMKDIGLRWEEGEIVSITPVPITRKAHENAEAAASDAITGGVHDDPGICRHCGAKLA
ncbi:DUF1127 domain-containing protein [Salinicola rhizosphaerae]|uniref:DUF1127 domain-containing protein n=1 Tax=Salinicola rhizosphaerae TaxID=1443141 RepID=UPI001672C022